MIIPLRTDRPIRINPYVNYGLIGLNVVIFILQLRVGGLTEKFALDAQDPQLYQFITYAFLHDTGGIGHLLFNMLFLYIFGNNVNDRLGNLAYLAFYLSGAAFAGLTYLFLGANAPVIGASGAVSAVTGAFMVLLPMTRVTFLFFFVLIGLYEVSSVWLILAYFILDVSKHLLPGFGGDNTAYTAHIGGTVFGVLLSMGLLAVRLLPRDLYDGLALIDRWNRRRQLRDLTRQGFDPFAPAPARAPRVIDPKFDQIQDLRATVGEAIAHRRLADAATLYTQLLALDPNQAMARGTQLDIANELFSRGDHPHAAAAYEAFLKQYGRGGDSVEQVQLMLGLIYARYLPQPARAKELLTAAAEKYHGGREHELAMAELAKL